jgi:hypothetical protein
VRDPELRQVVYLAKHGILVADFADFDPLTLSACAIIVAELESGGRWDFKAGQMILPSR